MNKQTRRFIFFMIIKYISLFAFIHFLKRNDTLSYLGLFTSFISVVTSAIGVYRTIK